MFDFDMTDKLSAVPALKAGVDFDWWAMTFQSHLLLNKELKPLMVGKRLREPDDPKLAELQEEREALEAILFSALVKAADDHGTQNVLMWQLIRPFQDQVNEGTRAFAALRGYYCPTKMSGAFLLFEKFHDARIAVGEDLTAFGARLQRMRADVLGAAPKDARANFEKEMGPLSMTLAVMKALKDMADEKEWDSFRRQVFADMDRGDIVGNLGDFEKVTHSLFGVTNRIKVEAESALEGQKAVAFRAAGVASPGGRAGAGGGGRTCYNCGTAGHISTACPKPRVTCDRCGKGGHLAAHCDEVRLVKERAAAARAAAGQGGGAPRPIAFMVRDGAHTYMDALLRHAPPSEGGLPRAARVAAGGEALVYLDTCASEHCFKDKQLFRGLLSPCGPVEVANMELAQAAGIGRAVVVLQGSEGGAWEAAFDSVRLCEDFAANLVSWPRLREKGFTLLENAAGLRHPNGRVFPLVASPMGPRFVTVQQRPRVAMAVAEGAGEGEGRARPAKQVAKKVLWHQRLGHLHEGGMNDLVAKGKATGVDFQAKVELPVCEPCSIMKSHRVSLKGGIRQTLSGKKPALPVTTYVATKHRAREDVHFADFFGPVRPAAIGGFPIVFGTAHARTGVVKVEPLRQKSGLVGALQRYQANVMKIEALRTDNEAVNKSQEVVDWCAREGIQLSRCAPYTPEQLAKIERMWRTLGEGACAMLHASGLPDEFWALAMDAMAYIYNRTPRASNEENVTPMESLTGLVPDLAHLRVFGCRAYMHVPKARRKKMQAKAKAGIFVGYSPLSHSYRVWVPEDENDVLRGMLYESRDVTFDESWRHGAPRDPVAAAAEVDDDDVVVLHGGGDDAEDGAAGDAGAGDAGAGELATEDADDDAVRGDGAEGAGASEGAGGTRGEDPPALRRSARSTRGQQREWWRVEPSPGEADPDEAGAGEAAGLALEDAAAFVGMVHGGDPNSPTVHEALSGPEREQYLESYGSERSSQTRRGVFTCIRASEVPAGRRVLPSKVVFKKKLLADGSLDKYKARICVNGNLQRAGEDYDPGELFAPVARFTSLRVLVSLAAANGWKLRQFDIETAFLYADLDEEVYVRPPRRFEEHDEDGEELVWKLHKSLYGLRQAPRNWYLTFTTWLLEYGFSRSLRDPCVFVYKDSETGELEGTMAVHVDDAPTGLAGADEWYEAFLTALKAKFNFKEGPLEWCLGVEVVHGEGSVLLRQTKYIKDVLARFGMQDCKPASVPLDPGSVFTTADAPQSEGERAEMRGLPYRGLVGSLLYCAVATRPDIAVAVSKISHVMSNPGPTHYRRALHVLRYLKGTMELGIRYSKGEVNNVLTAYSDADHGGCPDTGKSHSGYVCFVNRGPVSWMSKLQQPVAVSTTEAEYYAASYCASEIVFLRGILEDFQFEQKEATLLLEDNQGAVCLMKNEVMFSRAKHINVRYHQLRDFVKKKIINVQHCRTDMMTADILTKLLPKATFEKLRSKLLGYSE